MGFGRVVLVLGGLWSLGGGAEVPNWSNQPQRRSLGVALDLEAVDAASSLFPLLYSSPNTIYLLLFNTTGVMKTKRVDTGWPGVEQWISSLALPPTSGVRSERGGAAMYALLSLAYSLPPASSLALVTSRPPSDTDLASQALTALLEKKIQVSVYWTGRSEEGRAWLRDLATRTGGTLVDSHPQPSQQVSLVVREGLRGDSKTEVQLDSSIKDLTITIRGPVQSATLIPPSGFVLDGLDGKHEEISVKKIEVRGEKSGTWILEIRASDQRPYSISVDATSHLTLTTRTPPHYNNYTQEKTSTVELVLDGRGVRRIDEVELVDDEGRQVAALGHRDTRSHDDVLTSTVHFDSITPSRPAFLRLTATNNNGEQVTRMARIPDRVTLPTSIEVALGSMLTASPGQRAIIYFNVANNRYQPMYYDFIASDTNNWVRNLQPIRTMINGMSAEQVRVEVEAPYSSSSTSQQTDIVTLRARLTNGASVTQSAYFTLGQPSYDSTSPSIWYSYNGDCTNTLSPDNCYVAQWGANVTIQDSGSGVLKITARPVPLHLEKEFVSGTTDPINARFTASCCQTKVEITATDTIGNKYTKIIDIEKKWLTAGEISAIVLGSILLILIVVAIILLIVWCCRRKRTTLAIYPDH